MSTRIGQSGRLQGIQVLRGVAALLVLWAHLAFAFGPSNLRLIQTHVGAIGVDIFFVISGFVITLTASKPGGDWRRFLAHRVARVVPLYYALSAGVLIVRTLAHHPPGLNQVWNSFAFLPVFDSTTFAEPLHNYGWTLSFEMWFYLVFALSLAMFASLRPALILLPLGVLLGWALYRGAWFFPRFAFNPLVLEFCAGSMLCHFRARLTGKIAWLMLLAGVPLFCAAWRTDSVGWHHGTMAQTELGFSRAFIWGSFALCLAGATVYADQQFRFRFPKALLAIGDASYSMYLIQPFTLHLSGSLLPSGPTRAGCFLLATVLGGYGLWKYVEVPITARAKPLLERVCAGRSQPQPDGDQKAPAAKDAREQ